MKKREFKFGDKVFVKKTFISRILRRKTEKNFLGGIHPSGGNAIFYKYGILPTHFCFVIFPDSAFDVVVEISRLERGWKKVKKDEAKVVPKKIKEWWT